MFESQLGVAFITAAVTASFGSLLTEREFLPYDDVPNFLSDGVKSWRSEIFREQLDWALTTTTGHVYEPVAWIMKSLQFNVVGEASATSFAVTSFVAHLLTTLLLALTCFNMLLRRSALHRLFRKPSEPIVAPDLLESYGLGISSLLAAVLWSTHPLRAEAVSWCSAQSYCFAGLFAMLSVYAFLRSFPTLTSKTEKTPSSWGWYGVSIVCCGLSMMSKSVAAPIPLAHLALAVLLLPFSSAKKLPASSLLLRSLCTTIPFFSLAAFTAHTALQSNHSSGVGFVLRPMQRVVLSAHAMGRYSMQSACALHLFLPSFIPTPSSALAPADFFADVNATSATTFTSPYTFLPLRTMLPAPFISAASQLYAHGYQLALNILPPELQFDEVVHLTAFYEPAMTVDPYKGPMHLNYFSISTALLLALVIWHVAKVFGALYETTRLEGVAAKQDAEVDGKESSNGAGEEEAQRDRVSPLICFVPCAESAAVVLLPLGLVLPTLCIFQHGTDSVGADRYTYLPSMAATPFVAGGIYSLICTLSGTTKATAAGAAGAADGGGDGGKRNCSRWTMALVLVCSALACVVHGQIEYTSTLAAHWATPIQFYNYEVEIYPANNGALGGAMLASIHQHKKGKGSVPLKEGGGGGDEADEAELSRRKAESYKNALRIAEHVSTASVVDKHGSRSTKKTSAISHHMKDPGNMMTYAHLLNKAGRYQETVDAAAYLLKWKPGRLVSGLMINVIDAHEELGNKAERLKLLKSMASKTNGHPERYQRWAQQKLAQL
jgi:hypothetical protein